MEGRVAERSGGLTQRRRLLILARIGVVVTALLSIRYFVWRFSGTYNPSAPWFYWAFLAAELAGFGEVLLFYFTAWPQRTHRPVPAPPDKTVDVFIPTYNEPVALLRDTLVCAVSLKYPHTTWVLDDGNRQEVRSLALELGCRYLAREDRSHAKAGNLNHALKHSTGEFIVTIDADHVPMPDLIEQLLGFFADPTVAIVQANQDFYNFDSFQHATNWGERVAWQQQELFFNVIQPGKDAYNAAMYCGSPAMLRRSALEDVGGFATETVTEDMHTGLRLQLRGWRVVYYNRTVARGLAPQTFSAYNTQWHRWGLGAMQVLRVERPIFRRGLSLGQRLSYLASFYFYWTSVQKLFYLLVPAFCVLTGIFPLVASPTAYLNHFLPYLMANLVVTAAFQGGFMGFVRTERYNLVKLGGMLHSLSGLWQKKANFAVTPKARSDATPWRRMLLQLSLIALLIVAAAVGVFKLAAADETFRVWAYAVNVGFALFYLYLLVPAVRLALKRRELRATYRFPERLDLPVRFRLVGSGDRAWSEAFARNLNRSGLSITLDVALPLETHLALVIPLPEGEVVAEGTVRWTEMFQQRDGRRYANGIRFDRITPESQDAIVRYLFWEISPKHGQLLSMTAKAQAKEVAA
jgi:cellulose synthase (UDP-forming)